MSPPLRIALAVALFLSSLLVWFWGDRDSGRAAWSAASDRARTNGPDQLSNPTSNPPAPKTLDPPIRATSQPLPPEIRDLITALDHGHPVHLLVEGEIPRTLLVQPRRVLADNFRISLGTGSDRESIFEPQVVRTYGGRALATGGILAGQVSISIVDHSIAAVLTEENGDLLSLKTDPDSGELLTLRKSGDDLLGTCQHDLRAGTASVLAARDPATHADWLAGPRAQIAAAVDDPEVLNAGGINPGNGRIDKYVEPLPLGHKYDLSLRDLLALVVLDKNATGGNSTANLTAVTSEYLARMANVAAIHEHELGIRLLVQELILTPNRGEFADVPASLSDFRGWIGRNRSHGTYRWNAAAKFGNTATSNGVIGVAYVSALSGASGVSVNHKGFSHALVAHEMGHNMGSSHSSGGIMNSSIITGSRTFFTDVSGGETAAKDIYDHTAGRIYGPATMRHPEEIPFARDDSRSTSVNTPITFNPVNNDNRAVRNGIANSVLTLEELSRVQPLDAGSVEITGPNEVTFTPTTGWQGMAFFSYSIRGDVGNGGRGWLHKGDAAITVGSFNANSLNLTLAPGQVFSFRPQGSGDPEIGVQPQHAFAGTSRDDRKLIIIRVHETARGTDSFTFSRDGASSTVSITYLQSARHLIATPDIFSSEGSAGTIEFNPLVNDQGGGYLSPASVNPVINGGTRAVTYYFRHRFSATEVASVTSLNLALRRDDGAVVYLNGAELMRDNMDNGAVSFSTLASGSAGGQDETTYFPFNELPATALLEGDNLLAVEIHQSSPTSSDLAFDLSLTAVRTTGNTLLVPRKATWRYQDDGSDQGSAWKDPNFDDKGTFTLIGFGPNPTRKHITTYFRHRFEIADSSDYDGLMLDVRRDDGVVVYLNGTELVRDNMSAGPVDYLTTAGRTAPDDGADFQTFSLPATNLVAGANVLAVEIHQASATSSDLVFDLRLEGTFAAGGGEEFVSQFSTWHYLDDGTDQGAAWRDPGFDDRRWDEGPSPLGYPMEGSPPWKEGPGSFGFGDDNEDTSVSRGFPTLQTLPGAFRVIDATNLDPSKGSLTFNDSRPFTINGTRTDQRTGRMSFDPASNATGVATVEYTVEDGAGNQATGTVSIVLPLVTLTEPAADSVNVDFQNGLLFEAITHDGNGPPLSGLVTPHWSMQSGPANATVTFSDPNAKSTTARFSSPGDYVIRLTGEDNGFSTFQERHVRVLDSGARGNHDTGLVGWWKLDETGGTRVNDSSGNDHWGRRINSPIPASGLIGGAFEFDATDRYVDLAAHVASFENLRQGTIASWFQTTTGSERAIFAAADSSDANRDLRLYIDDGRLKFKVRGDLGTSESSLSSPQSVNDGQWHHAAVTVDAAMNATLYLDGEVVATGVRPFFAGLFDIDALRIGQTVNNSAFANPYRGKIDDLRIYPRVLGREEITTLASASRNHAPSISLPDTLPSTGAATFPLGLLALSVTDDGLPATPGRIALQWQSIAGPGGATFSNSTALAPDVTFVTPGLYTLQLRADDGEVVAVDEISIDYTGAGADAPVSLGLADLLTHQNAPDTQIDLFPIFEDPEDPDEDLAFQLTGNSNPTLFTSVSISTTNPVQLVLAYAPDAEGTSDLIIRAEDSDGNATTATFSVTVKNFQPTIPAQVFRVAEDSPDGILVGTIAAEDRDGDQLNFAVLGGNSGGVFAIDRVSGAIRLADRAQLDFETNPGYSLTVAVTDPDHPEFTSTAFVSIAVGDVNEPPTITSARLTVPENTPSGTVLTTLGAIDPDGRPVTLEIVSGNESGAFSLDPVNGFLTLVDAAPFTVALNPKFTLLVRATDAGMPALSNTAEVRVIPSSILVAEGARVRVRVPTSGADDARWFSVGFDDRTWIAGRTGVGYDTNTAYDSLISTDVEGQMDEINATVYLRLPFDVTDPSAFGTLTLDMKYDDGFIAYLNGVEVASRNPPANPPAWNSTASGGHSDDEAQVFEPIDLTDHLDLLVAGTNVLAIHGLNSSTTSSDMLILPQLTASGSGTPALPNPPAVTLNPTTVITENSATLNGSLDDTGGANPNLSFVWGRREAGEDPASWEHHRSLGISRPRSLSVPISGLRPGRTYFYNLIASNSGGTVTGVPAGSFTTSPGTPIVLLREGSRARGLVPSRASSIDAVWFQRGFDDSSWESGSLAAGYESSSGYEALIGNQLEFESEMSGINSTLYLRVPFTPEDPGAIGSLVLRMKYDDGFVAWLNGIEVASRNPPAQPLTWNSSASADHPDADATTFEDIDLSPFAGVLTSGENVLAIHGLNNGNGSSDLLISPELLAYPLDLAPTPSELYDDWARTSFGLAGADALITADPEHDGFTNLFEYGSDTDPNLPSHGSMPTVATTPNGKLRLTYRRRSDAAARGLGYRIEAGPDLEHWAPANIEVVESVQPLPGGSVELVTVRLVDPGVDTFFARVAVDFTP